MTRSPFTTLPRSRKPSQRTRGRPRLEELADLERELLDVAFGQFLKHGYGGTSMAMIVKEAGISKTTLYSRFSSKRELFLAIMQKLIDSAEISNALSLKGEATSLKEGLKSFAMQALGFANQPMVLEFDRLVISESRRFPELGESIAKRVDHATVHVEKLIAQCGKAEGFEFRDTRMPAQAFLNMVRGYHMERMVSDRPKEREELERWLDDAIDVLLMSYKDW